MQIKDVDEVQETMQIMQHLSGSGVAVVYTVLGRRPPGVVGAMPDYAYRHAGQPLGYRPGL